MGGLGGKGGDELGICGEVRSGTAASSEVEGHFCQLMVDGPFESKWAG